MGIEAYPELIDILLGRNAAHREGAPEPTLLPHLAPFAAGDDWRWLCDSIDIYAMGRSGLPPWPDLRNAVFLPIAGRLAEGSGLHDLLGQHPGLASFLPDSLAPLAAAPPDSGVHAPDHAEVLARLAARSPERADAALVASARAAIEEQGGSAPGRLLGWLGAAVPAQERPAVLEAMLASGDPDPEAVGAFLPHLLPEQQERLSLYLAETLGAGGKWQACQLLHLLPLVGFGPRAALVEIIRPGLLESGHYWPAWFESLIVARLNLAGEVSLALEYAATRPDLELLWQQQLQTVATADFGDHPFRDVLYAHPGAPTLLQEELGLASLAPRLRSLLDDMIDRWGGAGPPKESAPPPAPSVKPGSPPRGATRGTQTEPQSPAIPPPGEASEPPAEKRFTQVDVHLSENGDATRRTLSFEKGGLHEVQVRIAPEDMNWLQLDEAFPDDLLPQDEAVHRLTVLLAAPDLFDGALSQSIDLPKTGPSTVAKFQVTVPDDLESVQLMVHILHQGNHLETGYLSGPVTAGERDPRATGFTFRKTQKSAADLDHGEPPQLTIFKDGRNLLIHWPGHDDLTPNMAGIDKRVDKIREALFDGAHGAYQLDSGLGAGPGLMLLRILAAQGEFMRRKLFGDDPLDEVKRVQVVSPYSADFFPVEYLYDRKPPKADAALCPTFAASTGVDNCCEGCTAADDGSIVCPLGFWGLNRVIERQVRPIDWDRELPPEPRTGGDMLPPVAGVVLAASNHVNDENPNEVAETLAAFNAITGARSFLASDWRQWKTLSDQHEPVLLVALPHNVDNDLGFQALQISGDQELALNEIGVDYRPPAQSVILLLGCNTAAAAVEYEDFIAGLRGAGAAVVVGTITYVLGMQAAPLAREFVRQFWSQPADQAVSMGEVVRAVRTRMVRAGNPLALAITAFGCADWLLAPKGP